MNDTRYTLKFQLSNGQELKAGEIIVPAGEKGEKGERGATGEKGERGATGEKGERGERGYTPAREVDYWTDADKSEIRAYVENAILGGAW